MDSIDCSEESKPSTQANFTTDPGSDDPTINDEGLWDGRALVVPWPGNTYRILEKGTNRAICIGDDERLFLSDDPNANNRWLTVELQGYFGFQNPKTGRYIGHNQRPIYAAASQMRAWEGFVPRKHPSGGYQLLSPVHGHTMHIVAVSPDGEGLERRQHAETCWEFARAHPPH